MNIKLVFLDLDGTLLTEEMQITEKTRSVIARAKEKGVQFVACTGRPYSGLPRNVLDTLEIAYAITGTGTSIYKYPEKECIYADCLDSKLGAQLYRTFSEHDVHIDVFIEGMGYASNRTQEQIERLDKSEQLKNYFRKSRAAIEDPEQLILEKEGKLEIINLNFYPEPNGTYKKYEWALDYLKTFPELHAVTGGGHNLEISQKTASKGNALRMFAERMGVDISQTMAFGDTQNDISMIQAAGIGVAMGNATGDVKEAADYVTKTNEEDGVAYALEKLVLNRDNSVEK